MKSGVGWDGSARRKLACGSVTTARSTAPQLRGGLLISCVYKAKVIRVHSWNSWLSFSHFPSFLLSLPPLMWRRKQTTSLALTQR